MGKRRSGVDVRLRKSIIDVHILQDQMQTPDAMAHRGFKAMYPENTMIAFDAAIKAGAQCIETDIHLSREGVAVLSHDATLKRCFGVDGKIVDHDMAYLRSLRTVREPKQPMPTLDDLLQHLILPQNEHVWLLLDIKTDNDPDIVMKSIAHTIQNVNGEPSFWKGRIRLGVWNMDFVPYIGFSISIARKFLTVPNTSFNMFFPSIVGPFGRQFLRKAQSMGREVFVWTLNDSTTMKWSISLGVDAVCTNDPEKFLRICSEYSSGDDYKTESGHWKSLLRVWCFVIVLPFWMMFFGRQRPFKLRSINSL